MKTNIITRQDYLEKVIPYIDTPFIKVFTGVRHCGKSSILKMIAGKLQKDMSVQEDQIIRCNFDSLQYIDVTDKELFEDFYSKLSKDHKNYLFFEEIQSVNGWEKFINNIISNFNADIYMTSSQQFSENPDYIIFNVFPFSFKEYLILKSDMENAEEPKKEFENYIKTGGFPVVCLNSLSGEDADSAVRNIYNSIMFADVIKAGEVRKANQLERVVKYVFSNVGQNVSAKGISDYLKSKNIKVDNETVYNYLAMLEKSHLIYRCSRYDLKTKEVLKTQEKFYPADTILPESAGIHNEGSNALMENVVYLELGRRGYTIYAGKVNNNKICFVAEKDEEKIYIDFFEKGISEKDNNKKLKNLFEINDNYPKYILGTDLYNNTNYKGIKIMHIADFLVSENFAI